MEMFQKCDCTMAAGEHQGPCNSCDDGLVGVALFPVISKAVCKSCVMGNIFSSQSWAAAVVIQTTNQQKEERITVIFNETFCG